METIAFQSVSSDRRFGSALNVESKSRLKWIIILITFLSHVLDMCLL